MEVVEELRRWIEEEVVVQHMPRAVADLTAAKDSTIPVKLEAAGHHFKKKKYSRCSGSVDTRTHSNIPTSNTSNELNLFLWRCLRANASFHPDERGEQSTPRTGGMLLVSADELC